MKIMVAVWSYVFIVFLSQFALAQESETAKYSQKTLLKNWALSRCLAVVYADPTTKNDANATASAYLEYGKVSIEAYDELSALVNNYAKRSYGGSIKSDYNTMKCIDMFQSKELDRLANKLSKPQK
jgi:hypothetical protein